LLHSMTLVWIVYVPLNITSENLEKGRQLTKFMPANTTNVLNIAFGNDPFDLQFEKL